MSTVLEKAVEALQQKLEIKMRDVNELKKAINLICIQDGKPALYEDTESTLQSGVLSIKPDQYVGKPLATAVKEYLTMWGQASGSDEIFDALCKGGFEFSGGKDSIQKRNLRISLCKNPNFHLIKSSNTFGLAEKYGIKKGKKNHEEEKEDVSEETLSPTAKP